MQPIFLFLPQSWYEFPFFVPLGTFLFPSIFATESGLPVRELGDLKHKMYYSLKNAYEYGNEKTSF